VVSNLINSNPDNFALIGIHYGDIYSTTWGNKRRSFYDSIYAGTPCLVYDGLWDAWPMNTYASKLAAQQAVPTDVTLDLTAVPGSAADAWDVTAEVCVESGGVGKTATVYMVEVLDGFPEYRDFSRNGFSQAVDTEDVVLASGACETVVRTFELDATSAASPEDVSIIAWAQTVVDQGPAEVFQAAQMDWPFPVTGEVFVDGFESGDLSAWAPSAR
jgi:hypothetical protein